ncbi:MAG: hypothetical protein ACTSQJ_16785 [Promethearchaeota archaeon]
MKKCKRNIILIFGYLLIIFVLFIPYHEEIYEISDIKPLTEDEIPEGGALRQYDYVVYRYNSLRGKYSIAKDIKPINPIFGSIIKKSLPENRFKFLPLYIVNIINHNSFIKWGRNLERENTKYFKIEIAFRKKYDGNFHYYKLNLEFYITEIVIILIAAGFTFILLCVVLSKSKKKGIKY